LLRERQQLRESLQRGKLLLRERQLEENRLKKYLI
jgi:hypothetical protein